MKKILHFIFALFFIQLGSAQILVQDFEGTFPPTGWTVQNTHATNNWEKSDSADAITGSGSAIVFWIDEDQDETLISPSFSLVGQSSAFLNFTIQTGFTFMAGSSASGDIIVSISTNNGTSWTKLWQEEDYGTYTGFQSLEICMDLTAYLGQSNVKVKFNYVGNDADTVILDDFSITSCKPIQNVAISSLGEVNATIGWTNNSTNYDLEWGTLNFVQGSGTLLTNQTGNTKQLTGLSPSTGYSFYIRSNCGSSTTPWQGPYRFYTNNFATTTVPYDYGFESPTLGYAGWSRATASGTTSWNVLTGDVSGGTTQEGTKVATCGVNATAANAWLFSRGVQLDAGVQYRVDYFIKKFNTSTGTTSSSRMKVTFGTAATATGQTVLFDHTSITETTFTKKSASFTPTTSGVYYIGFNCYNAAQTTSTNRSYVLLDGVKVLKPETNDLVLTSVTVPNIISAGNYTFTGTVLNDGNNAITSFDVTYTVGGATYTHNVTGVNIAPSTSYTFTHSVPLNAVVGQVYNLTFNVPTVNGGPDAKPVNNTLSKTTQVPTGSTTYKPMIEKFTSSSCAPCASYNNSTFNSFYTNENSKFNLVAYQMSWPAPGDPYFTDEGDARKDFYNVNAITSLRINGRDYSTSNNLATITSFINAEAAKPGYFNLTANRDLSNNTAVVNYNITPYITGSFVLHTAVIEKVTVNNFTTNGETSFKHVMMKMVPDADGKTIQFTAGTPVSGQVTASLANTFIEENTDLEVILFIQDPNTKEVFQSYKAADLLSNDKNQIKTAKLYPNPANNFIRLTNIDKVDINITDITGKVVLQSNDVVSDTNINIAMLNAGVYFVNLKNDSINQTIKFIKQ